MRVQAAETGAFPPILDRPEALHNVNEYFADFVEVLSDMVDYGTHLIPRCWASSPRGLTDIVLLPVLTKQAVGFLDAGETLLRAGSVAPTLLHLRGLFEVSVYLAWICRRESDRRARAYYVANLRRRLQWAKRARKGTEEFRAMNRDLRLLGARNEFKDRQTEIANEIDGLEARLRQSDYRQMNAAFAIRRGKRAFDPDWYTVVFPRKGRRPSLYSLARQVGRRAEYRLIYEQGSEMMHSSRLEPHIRVQDSKLQIRSLRELSDFSLIAQLLMGQAIATYRVLLERYRPRETENFARTYIQRWRAIYLSQRDVQYEYVEQLIG